MCAGGVGAILFGGDDFCHFGSCFKGACYKWAHQSTTKPAFVPEKNLSDDPQILHCSWEAQARRLKRSEQWDWPAILGGSLR